LYECIVDITTAEEFDTDHWSETNIQEIVSKADVVSVNDILNVSRGKYKVKSIRVNEKVDNEDYSTWTNVCTLPSYGTLMFLGRLIDDLVAVYYTGYSGGVGFKAYIVDPEDWSLTLVKSYTNSGSYSTDYKYENMKFCNNTRVVIGLHFRDTYANVCYYYDHKIKDFKRYSISTAFTYAFKLDDECGILTMRNFSPTYSSGVSIPSTTELAFQLGKSDSTLRSSTTNIQSMNGSCWKDGIIINSSNINSSYDYRMIYSVNEDDKKTYIIWRSSNNVVIANLTDLGVLRVDKVASGSTYNYFPRVLVVDIQTYTGLKTSDFNNPAGGFKKDGTFYFLSSAGKFYKTDDDDDNNSTLINFPVNTQCCMEYMGSDGIYVFDISTRKVYATTSQIGSFSDEITIRSLKDVGVILDKVQ
jgi:hypothetical protein